MEFDIDLAVIHAYLCADGYVIKNKPNKRPIYYHVGFRNYNVYLLQHFQTLFYRRFGILPSQGNDGRMVVRRKWIYTYLTKNNSYYSKFWTFPQLDKEQLRVWLRAFFDCEAWVLVRKAKNRSIGMDLVNHNGLKKIQHALTLFGIQSKVKALKNKTCLRLLIYGKNNLVRFQKEINFFHPQKRSKLQKAINSYVSYSWDFGQTREQQEIFVQKLLLNRVKNIHTKRIRICSNKKQNLFLLKSYLERMFNIHPKVSQTLKNGIGTIYYELSIHRITDVKKIKKYIKSSKYKIC